MRYTSEVRAELVKTNASDLDVARAAWVSNHGEDAREKDGERVGGLIRFLYKNKHMSPFEHGSFTFFIDCPIFVAREFMRHRTFSYNEISARYTELEPKFYVPKPSRPLVQTGKVGSYTFVEGSEEQKQKVGTALRAVYGLAWMSYKMLKKFGVANEVARILLPVGIYTQFYATVNPRNLMHFLELRNDEQALYEIRAVAIQMEKILAETMPLTYKAYIEARS